MATKTTQEDFYDAVEAASVAPLWRQFDGEQPTEPSPLPPFIWRWATLEPLTERAAKEVPMEDVERRVLSLKNPHRGEPGHPHPALAARLAVRAR